MLYLDSAVIKEAREAARYPFVGGLSCNPTLLARAMGSLAVTPEQVAGHLAELAQAHPGQLYVQTIAQDLEGIIRDAHRFLRTIPPGRLIIKVPYSLEGLQAVQRLEHEGVTTCVTAVVSPLQAYVAAQSGASWIAPYCNRISAAGGDGVETVALTLEMFARHELSCRLLVASIKSIEEMEEVIMQGAQRVTVPMALLRECLAHPMTIEALRQFEKNLAWEPEPAPVAEDEASRETPRA
jgi:TalC/MipB family fructose-6-phosphate aldolase